MTSDLLLIVDRRDTLVRLEGNVLRIEQADGILQRVPLGMLGMVMVHGAPAVTCDVWRELSARGIPPVLVPTRGKGGVAWLGSGLSNTIQLRRQQHQQASDPGIVLAIARQLVRLKLRYQRQLAVDAASRCTIPPATPIQQLLSALSLRDKWIQRAVLSVLEPIGERLFHNDSFGYRPRRNVEMAHRRASERIQCGLPWLVDADITKFFDNIPHRSLQKTLREHIPDRELLALIDLWLAEGMSSLSFFGTRRGVAQGAVISPILCNFYLHELDVTLAGKNIPFVRFADDFLLFAPDERRANEALRFVGQKLKAMGLELHPDKTQVVRSHRSLSFLGHPF